MSSPVVQYHPIQGALDAIWNEGHTPKIIVDATHKDVIVPEGVRAKWKESLPIDLCASYPLNLDYSEKGLHVDLAFSGSICRCTFPWARIYLVIDRDTGTGLALREGPQGKTLVEPADSPKKTDPAPAPARVGWTPKVIKGGKS